MKKLKLFFAAAAALFGMNATAQTWTGNAPEDGKSFFIYNVGADKFINNGDPNENWGTNAYLQKGFGMDIKLELTNGAYTLETNVWNNASHHLGTSMWCDGNADAWTFEEAGENTYRIKCGDSYMVANDALNDVICGANTNDEKSLWKLVSLDDFKTAMQTKNYSATNPMDVSVFIQGRSFARNDGRNSTWVTSHAGEGWNSWVWIGGSDNKYYGNEAWNNTFDVHQDITSLPEGTYELQCSGFGTNGTTYIYATADGVTTEKALQTDNTTDQGTAMADKWKAIHIDNAFAGQSTGTFAVASGNLTIGLKRPTQVGQDWCIYDEFRLYYYGLDLSAFEAQLANVVAAAADLQGLIPTAAYNKIAAVVSANNKTYTTAAAYGQAIAAIGAAIETYASDAIKNAYSNYNTIKAEVQALATQEVYTGSATINTSAADTAVEAALDVDGINAAITKLYEAATTFVTSVTVTEGKFFDMTNIWMINPTVRKNTEGWTITGTKNGGYSWGVCNYDECEFYQQNFNFFQTLTLPFGTYEFGVTGFHRAGNHATYFYAGEDKVLIPGVESSVVNSMDKAKEYFDAGNGKLSLYFVLEGQSNTINIGIENNDNNDTDKWTIFRDFTLHYYGAQADYSVYDNQWAGLVKDANDAKTAHPAVTGTELTALNNAIADAPNGTSKANYLEKIGALDAALQAFNSAAPNYEAYEAYKAETIALWGSDLDVAAPTTGAEAIVAKQNLNVAQYNKVADEYTFSCTGLIGDFGSWTGTATVNGEAATPNYLSNEHWSGQTHAYYEQASNGWGSNAWTIKYEKKCTLPAGDYVLKVASRASEGTTGTISCSETDITVALPNVGAYQRGINKAGEASWTEGEFARDGEGYGWQWRFLPFTLAEEGEVTMTFYAEANSRYQWMSISDGELLSATKLAQDIVYDETKDNEIKNTIIADVTIKRNIVEGYNTVVLPFLLTANQVKEAFGNDAQVYNFSETSEDKTNVTVEFKKGDGSIAANTPVLVKCSEASTEQLFEGVQIVEGTPVIAGTNYSLTGIYSPKKLTGFDYIVNADGLAVSSKLATINGFCAYLKINSGAGRITHTIIDGEEVTTGINGLFIENSNNGKLYNLNGQEVKDARKGLYIQNGKKVIVK